jgi:hypothetical protein
LRKDAGGLPSSVSFKLDWLDVQSARLLRLVSMPRLDDRLGLAARERAQRLPQLGAKGDGKGTGLPKRLVSVSLGIVTAWSLVWGAIAIVGTLSNLRTS